MSFQPGVQNRLINTAEGSGYTSQQVIQLVGITYRQLDHWDKLGFIRPSAKQASGSGSRRLYSYQDLLRFRVAKRLLDSGASFQAVKKIFDYIEQLGDSIHAADLIIDENQVHYARSDEEILDLLKHGQGVLNFVSVATIREELDGKLIELAAVAGTEAASAGTEAAPAETEAAGSSQHAVGA